MRLQVRAGVVPGRSHMLDARNCQDALHHISFASDDNAYIVGALADGCGEGKHSEVGAQLAVQYVPYAISRLIRQGVALEELPTRLFEQLLAWLKELASSYDFTNNTDYVTFVHHHLLFTLLTFIITPDTTLVLAAGDGLVVINNDIYQREQDNMPTYIAYHLIDQQHLQANRVPLPGAFDLYSLPSPELKRLAIGSDAWLQEMPLLDEIWGTRTAAGLQLLLNRWSDARHFKDDASMMLVEHEA